MEFICVEQSFVESVEALVSEEDSFPPLKRRRSSTPNLAVILTPPLLKRGETSPEKAVNGSEDTIILVFTSGNTGKDSP